MNRIIVIVVTCLALIWAWYDLSGGEDFVAGDHGVTILADVKDQRRTDRPEPTQPGLQLLTPEEVKTNLSRPRVSTLQERDPSGAKTVSVRVPKPETTQPEPLAPAPEPAPLRTVDVTEPGGQDPDPTETLPDEALAALLTESIRNAPTTPPPGADQVEPQPETFEPAQSGQRISGLGGGLPLGTPIGSGDPAAAPIIAPDLLDLRLVSGTRVNLREGPATTYPVVTQLLKGDEVEVLDDTGDGWVRLRVLANDETGWMSDDFLEAGAN